MMRLAVLTLVAAAAGFPATLVRHPYLQNARTDGVAVLWATGEKGRGVVEYSPDQSYSHAVAAGIREFSPPATSRPVFQYQAELTGLNPGREYFYRILVDGEILKDGLRFRTAGPGPFTFLAFGDSGTGGSNQLRLADLIIAKENPALVLHTGDLSQESGTFEQLDSKYFAVYAPLMARSPFFPTPGNHDYYTDDAAPYRAVHSPPAADAPPGHAGRYYSFDWGNVHFVSLDSNLLAFPFAADRMLDWVDRDLARQNQFWKVAYFHHPPYPTGHHVNDPISATVRGRVLPILDRHGVQLVLSGHEHGYQRSFPLRDGAVVDSGSGAVYIITGGGGGGLQSIRTSPISAIGKSVHHYLRGEVRGSRLTVTAIDIDGAEIESLTLAPAPRISDDAVVNAATFTSALAPGSLISIFGPNLASEAREASAYPLPTELSGTFIGMKGQRLPLLSVSPAQINAQLPYGVSGPATLRVGTPNAFAETSIVIAEVAPAFLSVPNGLGRVPAVVRAADGVLVSAASPASRGEFVTIYLIGLGPVDGNIPAGEPAPGLPPLRTRYPVQVRIGDVSVSPSFAGLSPGLAGVYQVNVRLPDGLAAGRHPLRVEINGVGSETVSLPVGSVAGNGQ
ncbi:MAG: metallophosphoesterase [Bryobacterales bacterium]|nr:metallophosphoesterase [Bryobacterales bacterium]